MRSRQWPRAAAAARAPIAARPVEFANSRRDDDRYLAVNQSGNRFALIQPDSDLDDAVVRERRRIAGEHGGRHHSHPYSLDHAPERAFQKVSRNGSALSRADSSDIRLVNFRDHVHAIRPAHFQKSFWPDL